MTQNVSAWKIPIEELDSARSTISALTPQKAAAWGLHTYELPDGTSMSPMEQAESVLRTLKDNGYQVVSDQTLAEAWDRGYTAGHSRAMRRMSDEPHVPDAENPYRQQADA